MGGKDKSLKTSLGAALMRSFVIWFLLVAVLTNAEVKKSKMNIQSTAKLVAKEGEYAKWKSYPNYVSKRRVPTGPDPIHNRRAGKYRQQPGRV